MAIQNLRSSSAHKRPIAEVLSAGQIAINTNQASPGLFFKDSNGDLVKVGPVHIGTSAPNSSPATTAADALVSGTVYQILTLGNTDFTAVGASANTVGVVFTATGAGTGTGTVSGQQGNEKGEQWLDTTGGAYDLKIYDGSAWRSQAGEFVNVTGDTMTGDLVMNNANLVFEGATADDFETTLTVTDPTADRTIALPNVSGTVVTTGDTGTVTSTMIVDGTIVNADVNASAAIAGTKIDPDFGSQTIETTGVFSAAGGSAGSPSITFTGDTNTGIYRPGTDQVAISTNGTGRLFVDSSGRTLIGSSSSFASVNADDLQIGDNTDSAQSGITLGSTVASSIRWRDGADAGIISYVHSDDSMRFSTSDTEAMRIDSSGRLLVGSSSARSNFFNGTDTALVQTEGANDNAQRYIAHIYGAGGGQGPWHIFAKHRSNSVGGTTAVSFNDQIGALSFQGSDGSQFVEGARIIAFVDGTPGSDDMPGRLAFFTNGGSSSPTERMRIDSVGRVGIGESSNIDSKLHIKEGTVSGKTTVLTLEAAGSTADDGPAIDFIPNGSSVVSASIVGARPDASGTDGYLGFYTNNATTNSEKMRIDSAGRVGIGTSSPAQELHVAGNIKVDAGDRIMFGPAGFEAGIKYATDGSLQIASRANENTTFVRGNDGTESARIDGSGRLLVGTTSAVAIGGESASKLQLVDASATSAGWFNLARFANSGGANAIQFGKSRGTTVGDYTIVQDGDTLGSITFAGADGTDLGSYGAQIQAQVDGTPGSNDMPGRLVFSTTADGESTPTPRLHIRSGGEIIFGASGVSTAPTMYFSPDSGGGFFVKKTNSTNTRYAFIFDNPNGTVGSITTSGSATAYNTSSDYRLKENVVDIADGITRVKLLQPKRFNFNADPDTTVDGFLAHEVQDIVPEAITGDKDAVDDEGNPEYQGIDQSKLVPLLTAALQEAIAKIETLEVSNADLLARVSALEAN